MRDRVRETVMRKKSWKSKLFTQHLFPIRYLLAPLMAMRIIKGGNTLRTDREDGKECEQVDHL